MDSFANPLEDTEAPEADSLLQEEDYRLGQQNQEDETDAAMDSFANSLEDSPNAESLLQEQEHGLGQQNQEDVPHGAMDSFVNSLNDSPDAESLLQEQEHRLGQQNQEVDESDYSMVLTAVVDQCDICGKTFRGIQKLKEHIDAQHKGIKYICKICGSSMKYKGSLNEHMIQIHNIKPQQHRKQNINRTCKQCKIKFSSNQLLYDHLIEVHNESKPISCSACSEKFKSPATYGSHKYKHAQLVPYRCDICRLRYASKWGLRGHIESSEHQQKSADWPCHTEFDELDFVCYICNSKFDRHFYFIKHLSEHNKGTYTNKEEDFTKQVKCHVCQETVYKYRLESHLMIQHGVVTPPDAEKVEKDAKPTFKCSECDKTYKNREYFKLHMKIHSGEPKTQCDQCDYATYSASDMRKHKRHVHTGEKPYKCPTCNKAFADQSQRKLCMVKHTGMECYLCRWCKQSFTNYHHRKKHEQRMCPKRGNTPPVWECKECDKTYESQTGLSHHLKKHKREPKKCVECDFKTVFPSEMRMHKQEHAGGVVYKCTICSVAYLQQSSLQKHLRQHRGEPEKCTQCDFETLSRPAMWNHRRKHGGIYKCPACTKDFLQRATLRNHLQQCHPGIQLDQVESPDHSRVKHWKTQIERHMKDAKLTEDCGVKTEEEDEASTSSIEEEIKCHVCEETVTKYRLESHLMIQHGIITPPDAGKVEKDVRPRERPTFKCRECDKTYKNEQYFQFHMKSHSGEPKMQCDQCDYATYSARDMRKHVRSVHLGEKPYKCPICNKAFAEATQRKRCIVRHTRIKFCLCRWCKKSFADYNARSRHEQRMCPLRVKADAPPVFECKECRKSYETKAGFTQHMKKHKGEPEKCEECDFKTFCRSDMRKHRHEHAGEEVYKCPVCSQIYLNQSSMQNHMRQHTGDPEKCEQCDFTTLCRPEMWKHKRREHGAGVHKCPECSKDYMDRHTLLAHLKLHHPGTRPLSKFELWKRRQKYLGGRIHKCPVCPRGYFDRSGLWQHIKRQHPGAQLHQVKSLCTSNTKADDHHSREETQSEGKEDAKLAEVCAVKTKEADEASRSSIEANTEDVDEASSIEAGEQNDEDYKPTACDLVGKERTEVLLREKAKSDEQDRVTDCHLKDKVVSLKLEVEDCSDEQEREESTTHKPMSFTIFNGYLDSLPVSQLKTLRSQLESNLNRVDKVLHNKGSTATVPSMIHNKETANIPSMTTPAHLITKPAQSPLDTMDARMDTASGMSVVFL